MWHKLISDLNQDYKFHAPLSEEWIDNGLADLDVALNNSLKSFLLETDGLYDYHQFLWMVWNVRDLAAYNKEMQNDVVLDYNLHTYIALWSKYSQSHDFDNIFYRKY
jgi:hypothetical protein